MAETFSSSHASDDAIEYRSIEPLAIVAAMLGLASPVAFQFPILCVVPIVGMLAAAAALARIARDPLRTGRAAALLGLALSACFLAAPLARYLTVQWILPRQARPVADRFFELLVDGHPEQALLLQFAPDQRPPADDGLWSFYRNDLESRLQIQNFVKRPDVRMLLALGKKADVQFFRTNAAIAGKKMGLVDYWYTVTFDGADGRRRTMLMGLLMERKPVANTELNPWRVRDLTTEISADEPSASLKE